MSTAARWLNIDEMMLTLECETSMFWLFTNVQVLQTCIQSTRTVERPLSCLL
jgi:hypothetical protein